MRIVKILSLLLLFAITFSCEDDLTTLNVDFTADKTDVLVGDAVTFEVTGSADYWSIYPLGNVKTTGTEVEIDEEKKLETNKLTFVYDTPGTYEVKCVGTVLNPDDLSIERDSAFITITVVDNAEGAHTKFTTFKFTLKKDKFEGFSDKSSLRITAQGEIDGNNVVVKVPYSTIVNDLTAEFSVMSTSEVYYNGELQESRVTSQDFTNPIEYTIVSNDGTEITNTVTIERQAQETDSELPSFDFYKLPSGITSEVIASENGYDVIVSDSFDMTGLKAEFTIANFARAYINDEEQTTKKTTADYSAPVDFKVVAEDGSESIYNINVLITPSFGRFYFGTENTFVGEGYYNSTKDTVFVANPTNEDVKALVPTFNTIPFDASVKIDETLVTSGNDTIDFSNPVTYTITGNITSQIVVVIE